MLGYLLRNLTGFVLGALVACLIFNRFADSAPSPTGYTLNDIYEFIVSNGKTDPVEGDHALSPEGAPGEIQMRTTADIMAALREKLPCSGGGGASLPATGQKKCFKVVGTTVGSKIDCGNPLWPGQDGFYQLGCPMQDRFTDNGDGTVTDNCTGLMWQKDAAVGDAEYDFGFQEALQYCEDLEFAGYDDWRLPNIRELESIVHYGRRNPALHPVFTGPWDFYYYWSSTTFIPQKSQQWCVNFPTGTTELRGKYFVHGYVRAVRSTP